MQALCRPYAKTILIQVHMVNGKHTCCKRCERDTTFELTARLFRVAR